jgi:ubiquinone/menaquinone biosynthesis C-methylase UbiE
MDNDDIKRINSLWRKIYSFLASHIMEIYRRTSGSVLELGPFSGGISFELAGLYPGFKLTIADESPVILDYIQEEIASRGLSGKIETTKTDLDHLAFDDAQFDLVLFRGVFFFLDEKTNLLQEIYRILKEGGTAFVGGGYGKDAPAELIEEIADESRELNDRLGRKRFSREELEKIITEANLGDTCRIEEEGGVWIIIEKSNGS